MVPQTFRGRSITEATRAAEKALGPDAVVLTTRRVRRSGLVGLFGGSEIEIAATAAAADSRPPPPMERRSSPGPFASDVYRADSKSSDIGSLRTELKSELRSIQGIMTRSSGVPASLEAEIAQLRDVVERMSDADLPKNAKLARFFRDSGIEGKAAQALTKAIAPGDAEVGNEAIRDALADLVRVAPWPLATEGPAVIALVGPSGVGKTTTAAKLAARAMLEHKKTVTFVCCDAFRVGAMEQVERYAELLGAVVERATTAAELARCVAQATTDWVIVDTAGREPTTVETALGQIGGKRARAVLLCLPASTRADDAARFARMYGKTSPTGLVITKLDETRSPSGLVHAPIATGLPVSALCFGQRVPEDIGPATTGAILDALVPTKTSRRKMSS